MKTTALTSLALALVALAAAAPAASAADGTIAYHQTDAFGENQLWTVPAAGGAASQLTFGEPVPTEPCFGFCFSEHPDWAFDGSRIYYDSDRAGTVHVFSMAPDGSDVRQVTHSDGGFEGLPGVSPDGELVAYDGQLDETLVGQGIFLARIDGSGTPIRLTTGPKGGYDTAPEFSPDGETIAFQRFRPVSCPDKGCAKQADTGFTSSIHVIGVDGLGARRLTDGGRVWSDPQWSPDGDTLLIQSYDDPRGRSRGTSADLWTIEPDGSDLTPLTRTRGGEFSFSGDWSPDGSEVAFVHFGADADRLAIQRMALDGSGRTTVTSCEQFAFCDVPNWGVAEPALRASAGAARAASAAVTRAGKRRLTRRVARTIRRSAAARSYGRQRR